ncbi:hypothetical protein F4802DRAFT_567151 [Xylaria palmicola]|nr:hypothetical protein F4802DRAFT_567151 [Xylaria palmicola]
MRILCICATLADGQVVLGRVLETWVSVIMTFFQLAKYYSMRKAKLEDHQIGYTSGIARRKCRLFKYQRHKQDVWNCRKHQKLGGNIYLSTCLSLPE